MITKSAAKKMTTVELVAAKKDLREVIAIQEKATRDGSMLCQKLGAYHDELAVVHGELTARNPVQTRRAIYGETHQLTMAFEVAIDAPSEVQRRAKELVVEALSAYRGTVDWKKSPGWGDDLAILDAILFAR